MRAKPDSSTPAVEMAVRVRDAEYRPLDNAKVALRVTLPGGDNLTLDAEPDAREAGMYSATYVTEAAGAYRVLATATAPDGSTVGAREAGWAAQPAADEFARLEPDREFLKTIAAKTNGEVVDGENLASFVASLSSRERPDHRAVDLSVVAQSPLFPDRDRLPGRPNGACAASTAWREPNDQATSGCGRSTNSIQRRIMDRDDEGIARVISVPGGGRCRRSSVRRHRRRRLGCPRVRRLSSANRPTAGRPPPRRPAPNRSGSVCPSKPA